MASEASYVYILSAKIAHFGEFFGKNLSAVKKC